MEHFVKEILEDASKKGMKGHELNQLETQVNELAKLREKFSPRYVENDMIFIISSHTRMTHETHDVKQLVKNTIEDIKKGLDEHEVLDSLRFHSGGLTQHRFDFEDSQLLAPKFRALQIAMRGTGNKASDVIHAALTRQGDDYHSLIESATMIANAGHDPHAVITEINPPRKNETIKSKFTAHEIAAQFRLRALQLRDRPFETTRVKKPETKEGIIDDIRAALEKEEE